MFRYKRFAVCILAVLGFVLPEACAVSVQAKTWHPFQYAKVISQEFGSQKGPLYVGPLAGGIVAGHLNTYYNIVVMEDERYHYVLSEEKVRNHMVLPVNDRVEYYRDGKWFVFLDGQGKRHKFGLLSLTALRPAE